MSWYDKLMPSGMRTEQRSRSVPEGLWVKCPSCSAQLYRAELKRNLQVCPKCDQPTRVGRRLLDETKRNASGRERPVRARYCKKCGENF